MKLKHIALLLIVVSVLSACPFCTADTNDQSLDAYLGSAISLSMLPVLIAGVAVLVVKKLKKKFSVEN